jgi:hypothetical protein
LTTSGYIYYYATIVSPFLSAKRGHPTTKTPLQVENVLDLDYIGVKNDFPTVKFRKKRKSELSDEEKKNNTKHSKLRVIEI